MNDATTQSIYAHDGERIAAQYGVQETNSMWDTYGSSEAYIEFLGTLQDGYIADVAMVTRVRLLSDRGSPYWDVSYMYGELADGTPIRINLAGCSYDLRRRTYRSQLAAWAKAEGASRAVQQSFWSEGIYSKLV